jgi:nucleoid DNA-binding protein
MEGSAVTKRDIARAIAEREGITLSDALAAVRGVFDAILEALTQQGRIELRHFGVFAVRRHRARTARNPRTGEAVPVPERNAVAFKAGRGLGRRVAQAGGVPSAQGAELA